MAPTRGKSRWPRRDSTEAKVIVHPDGSLCLERQRQECEEARILGRCAGSAAGIHQGELEHGSDRGMEWEALKIVVRGVSIGKVYGIQRKLEGELSQQEGELLQSREGDSAVNEPGLLEVHRWLEVAWNRLDNLVRRDYRQWVHWKGGRSGRMLQWLLKRERPSPVILSLRGPAGDMTLGQERVNSLLRDHLRGVYASPLRVDDSQGDGYLASL
ncbi:hypothetical protein NDU88_012850 [Pleurodeles waltl]|uniref:Uncharacterized protein n=1 Tax=Pleurodeles waltl TaxID=8319 RepID=A0AAV7R5U1_PLEWA|nr:hypothetical protein NDU88_012850 [Pleurodeles waltl]